MPSETTTVARRVLWPDNPNILVRVAFLYVGQGASAVVFVADGNSYKVLLVDTNLDESAGGIDIPALMGDLLNEDETLHAFVNTHPHDDHLKGLDELSDAIEIDNVWHSGHVPSQKYGACYEQLQRLIDKVKEAGGEELILEGSRSAVAIGDAEYHVLSPAEHVTNDVNEEEADARYRRIHEMCVVIKFGKTDAWSMMTGDADRAAFENHITKYHRDRLPAYFLGASHHGSRTFFRENEDDDPYLEALDAINPSFIIVSAPKQSESKRHHHPHDDAMELYEEKVGKENVLHTGAERHCFICDIYKDGTYSGPNDDGGELAREYPLGDGDDDEPTKEEKGGFTPRQGVTTPRRGTFA